MDITLASPFITQLVIAMLLGMLIGTERTLARKAAGLRTYGIVALGSCLFVILGTALRETMGITGADLMRVVAGVITGIGFLGAGVIIFREDSAVGLTTAAGLWVAAGVGAAVGFGLYMIAFAATALTILVFTVFWFIEQRVAKIRLPSKPNGQQ